MNHLNRLFAVAVFFIAGSALAQTSGTVTNHAFPIGKGAGNTGYTSLLCGSAQLAVGQSAADPICQTITGDWTLSAAGVATLATVNGNVGTFGSTTSCVTVTSNAKGLTTAISAATCAPAIGSVTGLATGIATFLATPSSANLRAALTDEVGTGAAYFVGGALGTPASGTATNLTGLPLSGLTTQGAYTFVCNNSGSSAIPTACDTTAFTSKASPVSGDIVLIQDSAASNAYKRTTVGALASAGSVASFNTLTGAVTTNVVVQKFTATGTYTPTSGMLHAIVECIGSGGGGGGVTGSAGGIFISAGGESGSYSMKRIAAADIVSTATVTVGALGNGGAAGNNSGSAGADVTVVSNAVTLCAGKGGAGGGFTNTTTIGRGGAGAVSGTGDVIAIGNPGNGSYYNSANLTTVAPSGGGGSSSIGGGGTSNFCSGGTTSAGAAAGNYGSGGSGACASNTASTAAGGNGSAGIVIITEFVNL